MRARNAQNEKMNLPTSSHSFDQMGALGRASGKALKRPVVVVLASRSTDASWSGTASQETAHSAKTIILDGFDQMTSIWYRMAERNGAM